MEGAWRKNITPCKIKKMQFSLFFPLCAHTFDEFQGTPKFARHTKYVTECMCIIYTIIIIY